MELARRQRLLDIYGALLTEHQRESCRLHLDEDWSFTELAEHLGCSRSGAHDLVRRGLAQLEHYEASLGHAAELARRDGIERELRAELSRRDGVERELRAELARRDGVELGGGAELSRRDGVGPGERAEATGPEGVMGADV